MHDTNQKIAKYLKAVARRLNLPREVKDRVMSDFSSSVNGRMEAGQSYEQITAELGDAKKAAADLNEQMKEFAYRKSPWRFLFAACAAYGGGKLLNDLWVNLMYLAIRIQLPSASASVGVIGGADGPTAIFVTSPLWTQYLVQVLLLIVGIWGFLRLRKCKKKE